MKLLKKIFIVTFVLLLVFIVGTFFFVKSSAFKSIVENQLTKNLKNKCSIEKIDLGVSGNLTVTGLKILDDSEMEAVAFKSLKTKVDFGDLLTGDALPEFLQIDQLSLNLSEQNGDWTLAILNKSTDFRLERGQSINLNNLAVDLKKSGEGYKYELSAATTGFEPLVKARNFAANGKFDMKKLIVDQMKTDIFGGNVMMNGAFDFDLEKKQPLTHIDTRVIAKGMNLRYLKPFLKDQAYSFDGTTSADINFSLNNGSIVSSGEATMADMEVSHPVLTKILSLLETNERFLVFKKGSVNFNLANNMLNISDASFLNDELITVISKNAAIEMRNDTPEENPFNLKPGQTYLPIKIVAPYKIVRVKSMRSKENRDVAEAEFEVEGQFEELPQLLQDAVKAKSQEVIVDEVERHLDKLNKKLDIEIDGKKVDLNDILKLF